MPEERDWIDWTGKNLGAGFIFGTIYGGYQAYFTMLPPQKSLSIFDSKNLNLH